MNRPRQEERHRGAKGAREPKIARTKLGRGLVAARAYLPWEIVGEVQGEVFYDENYSSRYCMDLGDGACLEPAAPFRFMNHSCLPNCSLRWSDVAAANGRTARRMFVLVIRPIQSGDQLTIDYGWPAHMAQLCRCGAPQCRGWIVSGDSLDEVLDQLPLDQLPLDQLPLDQLAADPLPR